MTPKEHAIILLAKGLTTSQVAAAVGVSDGYISQLRADPDVQEAIAKQESTASLADITFDDTLDKAESLALDKIERNMQFANFGQALAAFRILNSAKRRKDISLPVDTNVNVTVNLTLPANSIPKYITNSRAEIIEVEGQTMISATAKSLDSILASRAQKPDNALPKITALDKAAEVLDNFSPKLRPLQRAFPQGLPSLNNLSADIL